MATCLDATPRSHASVTRGDCYALRCAYLHQGDFDTTDQPAHDVIERFHFVVAPAGSSLHRNQHENRLLLGVPEFSEEMCAATERWIPLVTDAEAVRRLNALATIEVIDGTAVRVHRAIVPFIGVEFIPRS
jgi:hypothetical protein